MPTILNFRLTYIFSRYKQKIKAVVHNLFWVTGQHCFVIDSSAISCASINSFKYYCSTKCSAVVCLPKVTVALHFLSSLIHFSWLCWWKESRLNVCDGLLTLLADLLLLFGQPLFQLLLGLLVTGLQLSLLLIVQLLKCDRIRIKLMQSSEL